MLRIGMLDVDGHNFPNLAQMKISAYHKAQGDIVKRFCGLQRYDTVYQSKVFDNTYSQDYQEIIMADKIIKGGTGYGLDNVLPQEIESIYPDYSLYGITDTAYGFITRGCPRACGFCIVANKEGRKSVKVANLDQWWNGQKNIVLLDPNLLASKDHLELLTQLAESKAWIDYTQGLDARLLNEDNINAINKTKVKQLHFAWDFMEQSDRILEGLALYQKHGMIKNYRNRIVYVLVNYNTFMEENLYRIYHLRDLGYNPFVMIYDKPNAPKDIRRLQRWVNNRRIWQKCDRFEDYR